MKSFIVGYDYTTERVYIFKTESDAAICCNVWQVIEAETAKESKEIFLENHKPEVEE